MRTLDQQRAEERAALEALAAARRQRLRSQRIEPPDQRIKLADKPRDVWVR